MTYLIHGTVLSGLAQLISDLGGNAEAIMRSQGIDPATTEDFESFVRYADTAAVLSEAARVLDAPDIGMQLASRQNLRILGPLSVILRNAATVGEAIDGVCRFLHTIVATDTMRLVRTERVGLFTFDTILRREADRRQMVEKSLVLAMKSFRMMIGEDFVPLRVTVRHDRIAPLVRYIEMFGRAPEFGAEYNSIHLPLQVLNRPLQDRDEAALALAENYLAQVRLELFVADHVRDLVRRLLVVKQASLVNVASAMSMHPRVVQRRLAEEGTTFEQILDDVRQTMAWDLSATAQQVSQIARTLGYSEQSSYSRACRRWFGETPRELQRRRRSELQGSWEPA